MNELCEYVYILSVFYFSLQVCYGPCVLCVIIVCVLFLLVGLWCPFLCVIVVCFISLSKFVMVLLPTTDSRLFLPRSWLAFVCKIDEWMYYVRIFMNCLCFIYFRGMWVYLWIVCVLFIFTGMWVYLWSVCVLNFFEVCEYVYEVFVFYLFSRYVSIFINCLCFKKIRGMWVCL